MKYVIKDNKSVFKGFFKVDALTLDYDCFEGGQLNNVVREVFMRGEAVGVLLVDIRRQQIILVEQFRAGAAAAKADNPWLLELVAGIVEPDESPDEVAGRESEEEAGCVPDKLIPLYEYWVSPGGSDEKFYLFCGLVDAGKVAEYGGLADENEDIKVHILSFQEAFSWLEQGRLNNAMTIIGVQWLMLNQSQLNRYI